MPGMSVIRLACGVTLVALGLAATVVAFFALFAAGLGVDTPIHAEAAIQVRGIADGASLQQAYDAVWGDQELYGILMQQLGDGLHALFGGGSGYLDPGDLSTYRWEGAANIVIAALGAGALGVALGAALRSFLAGAFAWAATMTVPLYLGMSHVDFKDMPIAAGLAMVSAALIFSRMETTTWWPLVGVAALGGLGAFFAVGARTGAWPLVLVLMVVCVLIYAARDAVRRQPQAALRTLTGVFGSVVIALGLIWLTNPIARIDLFQWLMDSATRASQYPTQDVILTAGVQVSSGDIPWWYVPAWFSAQLPVLMGLAVLGGLVAFAAALLNVRWSIGRIDGIRLVPVVVQGLFLPLAVVATGAVLYDGVRHLLFVVPGLAGIAAVGVANLERSNPAISRWHIPVAASLAVLIVAVSLLANLRWYPYSYAFINPMAGLQKDPPAWQIDYWGVSRHEGVDRLREAGVTPIAAVPLEHSGSILGTQLEADIRKSGGLQEFGVYQFNRYSQGLAPPCRTLFTIERDGLALGSGGICPIIAP